MIVPTTILSLAALSVAESNSFGKRGLRKSTTPTTAILVVSGTAVICFAAGFGTAWLAKKGGGVCNEETMQCEIDGCKEAHYLSTAQVVPATDSEAAVAPECTACPNNTWITKGTDGVIKDVNGVSEQAATVCDKCKPNYFRATPKTGDTKPVCTSCGDKVTLVVRESVTGDAQSLDDDCFAKCVDGEAVTGGNTCVCIDASNSATRQKCDAANPTCSAGACS